MWPSVIFVPCQIFLASQNIGNVFGHVWPCCPPLSYTDLHCEIAVTAPRSLLLTHITVVRCQPKTRQRATWSWGTLCCPSSAKACRPLPRRNCTGASRRKWSKSPRRSWKSTRWHMEATVVGVIFSLILPSIVLCTKTTCYPTSWPQLSDSVFFIRSSNKAFCYCTVEKIEMFKVSSRLCLAITEDLHEAFSVITKILNMKTTITTSASSATLQFKPNMKLKMY